ncbi:MAG: hypothetical protein KDA88_24040, partial [Planctomycetaceae bacterium]|nr:hypothetical protein [Planctomycetaceae bacterium]
MSNSFHPLTLSPLQLVILLVTLLISVSPVNGDDAAEREFTLKVLPLLKDKCLGCHGGDPSDIKGEYSIVDRDHLLGGGESGDAAVVPGRPGESPLLSAIRWENLEMPPKENDRLTSDQISTIERWIKAGAPWPDEDTQARIREEESKKAVT